VCYNVVYEFEQSIIVVACPNPGMARNTTNEDATNAQECDVSWCVSLVHKIIIYNGVLLVHRGTKRK
jgi:hypothetical protein